MKSRGDFRGRHSQRPPLRVDNLQGWMTFDYLNHGFGIPNEYLKNELHITSNTYPKITLRKAASLLGATTTDFINITSKAISIYLQNSSSTQK
jgi:hypothetical protein